MLFHKKTAPARAYKILEEARDVIRSQRGELVAEREVAVKQAIAQYNIKHNDAGKFALTANDVPKEKMKLFVQEIKAAGNSKSDFFVDIMLARGERERASDAAMKQLKPHGQISIVSLVSAEESEVGDDQDDQLDY